MYNMVNIINIAIVIYESYQEFIQVIKKSSGHKAKKFFAQYRCKLCVFHRKGNHKDYSFIAL